MQAIAMIPIAMGPVSSEQGVNPPGHLSEHGSADGLFKSLLGSISPRARSSGTAQTHLALNAIPQGQSLRALAMSAMFAGAPEDEPQVNDLTRRLRHALAQGQEGELPPEVPVASLPPEIMGALLTQVSHMSQPALNGQVAATEAGAATDQQALSFVQPLPTGGATKPVGPTAPALPDAGDLALPGQYGSQQALAVEEAPTFQNLLRLAAQVDEEVASPRVEDQVKATPETNSPPARSTESAAQPQVQPVKAGTEPLPQPPQADGHAQPVRPEAARPEAPSAATDSQTQSDPGPNPEAAPVPVRAVEPPQTATAQVQVSGVDVPSQPESAPTEPRTVPAEPVLRQVSRYVKVMLDGDRSEVRLKLHPAELGAVTVKVVMEQGVVKAHLTAQEPAVRAALEANLDQLRTRLTEQGLNVASVSVSSGSDGTFNSFGQSHHAQQEATGQQASRRQREESAGSQQQEAPPEQPEQQARLRRSGSRLDRLA